MVGSARRILQVAQPHTPGVPFEKQQFSFA